MFTSSLGSMRYADNIETGLINRLKKVGGLTFLKDFKNNTGTLNADYAVGSPTATYTRTTSSSAPATVVSTGGIIDLITTNNLQRNQKGYYDTSGFASQSGLMMEASGTNLLTRTDGTGSGSSSGSGWSGTLYTGWIVDTTIGGTASISNPNETLINISGSTAQQMSYTSGSDVNKEFGLLSPLTAAGSVVSGDTVTYSVLVKSNGTVNVGSIRIRIFVYNSSSVFLNAYSSSDITSSLGSTYKLFTFTQTIPDATADRIRCGIYAGGIDTGETFDISFHRNNAEKNPYATSWIPTAASSLSRGAEVLKYETAGNRTAASETIFVKFAPESVFANDGISRALSSTDTKSRFIVKGSSTTGVSVDPNFTDNAGVIATSTTVPQANTSYVVAGAMKHSSPYVQVYINGTSEATYTAGDFTDNAWGTNFTIGSSAGGIQQLNGIIQSVAIFNRALSASEVAYVTKLMQAV